MELSSAGSSSLSQDFEMKTGYETKRRVMEAYDSMGGRVYEELYRREQEEKYTVFMPHIRLSEGAIILDDGCGTGLLLERLRIEAVGVDISSKLLSTARSKGLGWTHLIRGDAENLPFRDGIYRCVFAVTLINNTPDPTRAMREMARVSRSEGKLIITALKKSFSRESFLQLLCSSGLRILTTPRDEDSRDWIAIAAPESG
jgi:ubiquinone/menaquinone biosynthesis C-methylase UbiE